MNVVFEIAQVAQYGPATVSIVYSGSDSTISVSGLGDYTIAKAKEQGKSVVEMVDMVRVRSTDIIKPAEGNVYCYAGMIVQGDKVPEPWEQVETVPIIVEMKKELAKSQNLFKLMELSLAVDCILDDLYVGEPGQTQTVHLVDKLKVSRFRQDQWNELRNTTAFLVRL